MEPKVRDLERLLHRVEHRPGVALEWQNEVLLRSLLVRGGGSLGGLAAWCGGLRARRRRVVSNDVLLQDPAALPGPRDLGKVDAPLPRHPAHRRRRQDRPGGGGRGLGAVGRSGRQSLLLLLFLLGLLLSLLHLDLQLHQSRPHLSDVSRLKAHLLHHPGVPARDLDIRLIGLNLADRLELVHGVPRGDEPLDDLALRDALSGLGQREGDDFFLLLRRTFGRRGARERTRGDTGPDDLPLPRSACRHDAGVGGGAIAPAKLPPTPDERSRGRRLRCCRCGCKAGLLLSEECEPPGARSRRSPRSRCH